MAHCRPVWRAIRAEPAGPRPITAWLQSQGFTVIRWRRAARYPVQWNRRHGGQAFHTQILTYIVNGKISFRERHAISLPSAFASTVNRVGGLHDFKPQPRLVRPQGRNRQYATALHLRYLWRPLSGAGRLCGDVQRESALQRRLHGKRSDNRDHGTDRYRPGRYHRFSQCSGIACEQPHCIFDPRFRRPRNWRCIRRH